MREQSNFCGNDLFRKGEKLLPPGDLPVFSEGCGVCKGLLGASWITNSCREKVHAKAPISDFFVAATIFSPE